MLASPVGGVVRRRFCASVHAHMKNRFPGDIHNNFPGASSLTSRSDEFGPRHIGSSSETDIGKMCATVGVSSVAQLIDETIPSNLRRTDSMLISDACPSESEALLSLASAVDKNVINANFIGQGYYGTLTPAVIQRNLLDNPAWYTAYTPYQAEISQGRLEGLLVFQTMVANLTGMEVSNCSLLDEGTAAAEAMSMFARSVSNKSTFLVSSGVHPQTIVVVQTRARYMGVEVVVVEDDIDQYITSMKDSSSILGLLVQYPDTTGRLVDYSGVAGKISSLSGGRTCVAVDPLALTICEPPKWADAVVGTMQRFGVPLFNGGPHAAFLATRMSNVRRMPGRLVGESVDAQGNPALRLALQTREQHIRLDKATSNICTSQALLANMSAMYAVYHGPSGLTWIAMHVQMLAGKFAEKLGLTLGDFFGTVVVPCQDASALGNKLSKEHGINVRNVHAKAVSVSFDETHTSEDVDTLVTALAMEARRTTTTCPAVSLASMEGLVPPTLARTSPLLPQKIFNTIRTETEMMRYLFRLQSRDLSLTSSMITLGSCTMKLNSASSLFPLGWAKIACMHPFAPAWQKLGYETMLDGLKKTLCEITAMTACSLQPASGAAGEYAGLLTIRNYFESIDQSHRDVVIIPRSAHGTNSASAAMMGLQIRWVNDASSLDEFRTVIENNKDRLAALMITYPSTHGSFDPHIREVCDLVHQAGGNVYMDGANMNAQLGLTAPGFLGADVCHLNLHKTFSIPHGGGGPGMGPICVKAHLEPFLPTGVGSTLVGQAGIACVPWMFITMLGSAGLRRSAKLAILNANYMAARLKPYYPMPFLNPAGRCSHEFIIDVAGIRDASGVTEEDIAKRLMDYGFHAPTMSWPVPASLMIEPTESESVEELDRFVDAMVSIRAEIAKIEAKECDAKNNPLKNAPHTLEMVTQSEWKFPYSRETAAFPLAYIRERGKFWPAAARISNSHGDKHLVLNLKC